MDLAAAAGGAGSAVLLLILLVLLCLATGVVAFWIWGVVDLFKVKESALRTGTRLVWILLMISTGVLGTLIYAFVARPDTPPTPTPT